MAVLTGEETQRLLIQTGKDGCYGLLLLEPSAIIGHVSGATTLNVYAPTEEECEQKLAELIAEI